MHYSTNSHLVSCVFFILNYKLLLFLVQGNATSKDVFEFDEEDANGRTNIVWVFNVNFVL